MEIQQHVSLKPFNTFGIDVTANYFARFADLPQLQEAVSWYRKVPLTNKEMLVLGGGSNILLRQPVSGLVLKNEIRGIEIVDESEDEVYVRVGAGENWHELVMECVRNQWAGVENLSLIPGNTGAAPMQNIGAYGMELKDVFHALDAWHIEDEQVVSFAAADCEFGYRESVFKRKFKNQFIITYVTLRLSRKPVFNIQYGAIKQELEKMGVQDLSIRAISDAVIRIRQSKLPDPARIGNAGSFFKNPEVEREQFEALKEQFPDIVGYPAGENRIKLAAGWLIEHCGPDPQTSWKGFRTGDAGCHQAQALVLVNYGSATGDQIYDLSERILDSVYLKFKIRLEREVNVL